MTDTTFESLGLSDELNRALTDMGFTSPTPIQAQTIPLLLNKRDVMGQAQTGTGKTAAFAIPILENIDLELRQVQAAVICPTRELAVQVTEEFRKLGKYKPNLSVVCIYGGQPMERQLLALQSEPQIIVGTPGRMLDHLWSGNFHLSHVRYVVLDEADEMLDMGFREDIDKVFDFIPQERQTALFSATMPKAILELTRLYQQNPEQVKVEPQPLEASLIDQYYTIASGRDKLNVLTHLIDTRDIKIALIFCNTKRQVDDVASKLKSRGYGVEALHGGLYQHKRDSVMGRFRKGNLRLLVATDVAARGIDVKNVDAVFNYDIPADTETYVHRIGRTGRAGKTGQAFTLVSPNQMQRLNDVQRVVKNVIKRYKPKGTGADEAEFAPHPTAAQPGGFAGKKRRRRRGPRKPGTPGQSLG